MTLRPRSAPRTAPAAGAQLRRAMLVLGVGLAACGGDVSVIEPTPDGAELYWALTLDQRAVTLALTPPYDTLTVVATPRNANGNPLEGLGAVTYTSTDLARVRVGPDGVLKALATGSRIPVVAELHARGLTHVDTMLVSVEASPPAEPFASLSIHPVAPDSAKLGVGAFKVLVPTVLDAGGAPVLDALVDIQSLNPKVASVTRESNMLIGAKLGTATLIASATAYGVRLADTLTYTVGLPVIGYFQVTSKTPENRLTTVTGFVPSEIRVGVGATVAWIWSFDIPATDVVFDDPMRVAEDTVGMFGFGARTGAGNMPAQQACTAEDPSSLLFGCLKTRNFPVPGVYSFRSTLTGATGKVIVEAEPPAATP